MTKENKYIRKIAQVGEAIYVNADVYEVLEAFNVNCSARQHAIKKLLCAGIRGKGNSIQDLTEARDALSRAIELEERRVNHDLLYSTRAGDCAGQLVLPVVPVPVPKAETNNSKSSFGGNTGGVRGGQSASARTSRTTRKR